MSMSNMDSASSPAQNWLGFSLSNHPTDSSHLCLFESFNSSPRGTVVTARPEEDATAGATATDLSIFAGAAKLENFLGTCGASSVAVTAPQTQQRPQLVAASQSDIYDSELKSIAASFLRGFSTENAVTLKHPSPVSADQTPKKAVDTFGQRTSIYRGVTRHRWTGRYEAHLWDNSCRREGQSRKGRQVYLGGYDKEEKAARAYDLAALKYWGPTTTTNFPISEYEKELEEMKHMTRQEFVASLRRKSSGFSRGASIYRGVTRHHQHGRWQARIGRVAGNKDLYLGTFSTQEEAAEAYDIAAIKFRGLCAVTNFDMSRYDVKSIMSSNLPIGGMSGKSKNSSDSASDAKNLEVKDRDLSSSSSITFASQPPSSTLNFALPMKQDASDYWSNILGYQNNSTKTSSPVAPNLFQSSTIQNPTAFNMEFSAAGSTSAANESSHGLLNTCYVQQQGSTSSSTSSIPLATPIALNSSNSYEYGSWGSPSLHTFTSVKPGLSVFQTPIFGIE